MFYFHKNNLFSIFIVSFLIFVLTSLLGCTVVKIDNAEIGSDYDKFGFGFVHIDVSPLNSGPILINRKSIGLATGREVNDYYLTAGLSESLITLMSSQTDCSVAIFVEDEKDLIKIMDTIKESGVNLNNICLQSY